VIKGWYRSKCDSYPAHIS